MKTLLLHAPEKKGLHTPRQSRVENVHIFWIAAKGKSADPEVAGQIFAPPLESPLCIPLHLREVEASSRGDPVAFTGGASRGDRRAVSRGVGPFQNWAVPVGPLGGPLLAASDAFLPCVLT